MHNEMSYARAWPLKIWFYSVTPATSGGQTPIADSRKVLARISPRVRDKFAERQVMYVRNYGHGVDLSGNVPRGLSPEQLKKYLFGAKMVRCDETAWAMWGISMAGWNALLSAGLAFVLASNVAGWVRERR